MRFANDFQRELYYRAQIDYCYWRLQEISEHHGDVFSPLETIINEATGFNKSKLIQNIQEAIYLIGTIVRCKKKIGFDPSNDRKFLIEVKKLKTKGNEQAASVKTLEVEKESATNLIVHKKAVAHG